MGRGEPCCMPLRKSYVTPPVEMVVAWCGLGAGEGGAGEKKLGYFPLKAVAGVGGKCNQNLSKAVTNKQIPKSRDLSPAGRAG